MPTNKELILAQREAYVRGIKEALRTNGWHPVESGIEIEAAKKYPLPKITRPRVVIENGSYGSEYKIEHDNILVRRNLHESYYANVWYGIIPMNVIKDLLANPTEEVEDDS